MTACAYNIVSCRYLHAWRLGIAKYNVDDQYSNDVTTEGRELKDREKSNLVIAI